MATKAKFDDSRGLDSLRTRLYEHGQSVEYFERKLAEAKRLRDLLIEKAVRARVATRDIAEVCGVTSVRVSQISRLNGQRVRKAQTR